MELVLDDALAKLSAGQGPDKLIFPPDITFPARTLAVLHLTDWITLDQRLELLQADHLAFELLWLSLNPQFKYNISDDLEQGILWSIARVYSDTQFFSMVLALMKVLLVFQPPRRESDAAVQAILNFAVRWQGVQMMWLLRKDQPRISWDTLQYYLEQDPRLLGG